MCWRCWERVGIARVMLNDHDILAPAVAAAGGDEAFARALSRKRDKASVLARGRVARAVWDRLSPLGYSKAEAAYLLGCEPLVIDRALAEA